jgi:ketosteroid isomerase-like protein
MEAMRRWSEVWVDRRVEPEEFIAVGDQVIVIARAYAKLARTGMALDRQITEVWTLRGGRVVEIRGYRDREEALAAVAAGER